MNEMHYLSDHCPPIKLLFICTSINRQGLLRRYDGQYSHHDGDQRERGRNQTTLWKEEDRRQVVICSRRSK